MMWKIIRYDSALAGVWDEFIETQARNATFLFRRGYMDYHSDRFTDCSMMAYKNGRLLALLPANISSDGVLHSHQGLTYGGWITSARHFDATDMLPLWETWLQECRHGGIREVDYKPLPWIFASRPAQEDIYMLFRSGARLTESNLSSVIDPINPGGLNTLQRRHLRKIIAAGAVVEESRNIEAFHNMLSCCLEERHGAAPVHSAAELRLLTGRFPENIRLYVVRRGGELLAGVCLYVTSRVIHAQYIASTPEGRRLNGLTLLFDTLIRRAVAEGKYFDFGISNEDHGRYLNEGLLRQKASYGASGVTFDRWTLPIESASGN